MTDCAHQVTIKVSAASGKSKILCAECLWEIRPEIPASTGPDEPYTQTAVMMLTTGALTDWEADFIKSLAKMRQISPKQQTVWNRIVRKYFPKGIHDSAEPKGLTPLEPPPF